MSNRPLNVGLVGGGKGAFIVHPHQKAIHFDGTRRVVAGALFPDPKIALEEAANWPYPIKGYGSYDEMIVANASLPPDQKLDYILIVTPNFVHYDPAMKAMKAGIAVFCEKPLCLNLKEANDLVQTARKLKVPFGLAHTYLGHWTSRLSRYIVRSGLLGDVRWVDSYYLQGWLATKLEATGQTQAVWRVDPKRAGGSGCAAGKGAYGCALAVAGDRANYSAQTGSAPDEARVAVDMGFALADHAIGFNAVLRPIALEGIQREAQDGAALQAAGFVRGGHVPGEDGSFGKRCAAFHVHGRGQRGVECVARAVAARIQRLIHAHTQRHAARNGEFRAVSFAGLSGGPHTWARTGRELPSLGRRRLRGLRLAGGRRLSDRLRVLL